MSSLFDKMLERYSDVSVITKRAEEAGAEAAEEVIRKEGSEKKPSYVEADGLHDKIASMIAAIDESVARDADPGDEGLNGAQKAKKDATVKIAELIATDRAAEKIAAASDEPKPLSGFGDAYDKLDFSKLAEEPVSMEKIAGSMTAGMIGAGLGALGAGGATYMGMKRKQDQLLGNVGQFIQLDQQRDKINIQRAYEMGRASAATATQGGTE